MKVKRFYVFLAGLLFFLACQPRTENTAQSPRSLSDQQRSEIEQMLFQWENDWVEGLKKGNPSVLEKILAPDFIYTVNNGDLHDKDAFIALAANDPVVYSSFELDDMEARWYGDKVVVIIGASHVIAQDPDGNVTEGSARWTNVFVERDGQWQCVVGHSTGVEE